MYSASFVIFDMDQVLHDYEHDVRSTLLEELSDRPKAQIDEAVLGGPHDRGRRSRNSRHDRSLFEAVRPTARVSDFD